MLQCKFCIKELKNNSALVLHERYCLDNPNRRLEGYKHSEETKRKLSKITKRQFEDPKYRAKFSERMIQAVKDHPESYSTKNVSGRCKNYIYKGHTLKGKWELITAMWLDSLNVLWERDIKPFPYFWDGKWRNYFPDFYLPEYKIYIEVKGFKRERDISKWKDFSSKLLLIDEKTIGCLDEKSLEDLEVISE
jgi:hypothetical protein